MAAFKINRIFIMLIVCILNKGVLPETHRAQTQQQRNFKSETLGLKLQAKHDYSKQDDRGVSNILLVISCL
jgi:hypothetical protein